ncbi:MAG: helix-turn-helix domain-containing protein [Acidobacteria bacterium]|nr:helix-turn-helix domain-containing protein [Acidobacteriota bacterium]
MSKTRHDGALVRTFAVTFLSPTTVHYPVKGWDQLIYATQGALTVQTTAGLWILPAFRALWVPENIHHTIHIPKAASMRSIYLPVKSARQLPRTTRAVNVTPLLRELILACVQNGALLARKPTHRRLAAVLRDQLHHLPTAPLQLPDPKDLRAIRIAHLLRQHPDVSLPSAAKQCGAGLRTLERIFHQDTGMSLGAWLRRLRLQLALESLAAGATVTEAARASGYNGPSAFVAMFRREMGTTPARYFSPSAI